MPTTAIFGQDRGWDSAGRNNGTRQSRDTPIDWAHLSRFTLNDKQLENEVLGLFAMDAPRYLAKMLAARVPKDWIEAAHTLKGSARAVGAWNVAECAEALQLNAQLTAGDHAELAVSRSMTDSLERLHRAVLGTVAYIEQLTIAGRATSPQ